MFSIKITCSFTYRQSEYPQQLVTLWSAHNIISGQVCNMATEANYDLTPRTVPLQEQTSSSTSAYTTSKAVIGSFIF